MKTVRLEDFAAELGKLTDGQVETLKNITYNGLLRAVPMLVAESPVDTGQYASSWAVERNSEDLMSIGNYAPHAAIIEHGARPFVPPIGPLLEWARRVLGEGPPKDSESGRSIQGPQRGPVDPSAYSPEVRALAYATRNKIREVGMRPRHILENMIPKIIAEVVAEFKRGEGQ